MTRSQPSRGNPLGLQIFSSNHLHVLFHQFAERLTSEPLPPKDFEWIVVQSRGMSRWLNLSLAKHLGIAASIKYLLPKTFAFQLTALVQETQKSPSSFQSIFEDRQRLAWALHASLPQLLDQETFRPVRQYLRDDSSDLKRFQLASKTADCFDNYQLFRPQMLQQWSRGKATDPMDPHEAWQRHWWSHLRELESSEPLYQTIYAAIGQIQSGKANLNLPERISFFGVGSLPPLFLDLLACLAHHADVHLYVVTPTEAFWGDLRSPKEQLHQGQLNLFEPNTDDSNHELLVSLGRQGRDFFNLLQAMDHSGQAWHPLAFPVPQRDRLLHHLQADIAELIQRSKHGPHSPITIRPADKSLQIHACQGPLREMEVLRDQLLSAFQDLPDLRPEDVVILVPDIHTYTPFIQAVFANPSHDSLHLPFSIADQRIADEMPLVQALLALLETLSGRMTATEVMSLFEVAAIRRKFQIGDSELETLQHWVMQTRIAWAENGRHRADHFQVPVFEENSWRLGLDRLLLTYAMGTQSAMVENLAPLGQATTSYAELLGQFSSFMELLFAYRKKLARAHGLEQWADVFHHMLLDFFQPDSPLEEEAMQLVRDHLDIFPEVACRFDLEEKVRLPLVIEPLRQLLRQEGFGAGFITGRMTFCALKPMRTIPFKILCIAGLNDGEFPRQDKPFGFDLMARARKRGDRNIREDDRYLFLESMLAAKARLILSYVGYEAGHFNPLPPSSVLQELLTHLDHAFVTESGEPISHQIFLKHPAHPFDHRYFDPRFPQFLSYDPMHYLVANTVKDQQVQPFLTEPLEPQEIAQPIPFQRFIKFWVHPSRYFCEHVLGIRFTSQEPLLSDSEPLALDGLQGYLLDQRIFDCRAQGNEQNLAQRLRSEGLLPPGKLGAAHFAQRHAKTTPLVNAILEKTFLPEMSFQLEIGEFELEGTLKDVTEEGRVFAKPSRITPHSWVRIWLEHLVFQLLPKDQAPIARITEVMCLNAGSLETYLLDPVAEANVILLELLKLFQEGHQQPLPLFGKTSYQYAESDWKIRQPKSRTKKHKLQADWQAGYQVFQPVSEDAYIRLCFGDSPQFETTPPQAHQALAIRFWDPLLACRREVT